MLGGALTKRDAENVLLQRDGAAQRVDQADGGRGAEVAQVLREHDWRGLSGNRPDTNVEPGRLELDSLEAAVAKRGKGE